jgi:NAD+ diphosphatase
MSERRKDDAFISDAWAAPTSRVLVMSGQQVAADVNGLVLVPTAEAPPGERMLLGRIDDVIHFLVVTPTDSPAESAKVPMTDLRRVVGALDAEGQSLAVHAVSLGGWHQRHPRCSVCGTLTDSIEAGAARRCPACEALHFPRTDPAVIMLVVDDDGRCLLGHNAARPATTFSTLAGFVEPGESPEQAVVREVFEEAGIEVTDVTYAGSQPWPFPSSLMLGFFAQAVTHDITVDGEEITEARWFTREDVAEGIRSGGLIVPGTISISGALLTAWYGEPLPQPNPGEPAGRS